MVSLITLYIHYTRILVPVACGILELLCSLKRSRGLDGDRRGAVVSP